MYVNQEISELIGIILGDGSIGIYPERWQYQLDIALNSIDEPRYFIHVKNLMESIFNEDVNISDVPGKGVSLRYYKKDIVEFLLCLGLVSGNKTTHQVSVPNYILENKDLVIPCLKGLFDTDGSISIDSATDLRLRFTSCSKTLVQDFYEMCKLLHIIPSPSLAYNSKRNSWRVQIAKKDSLKKFLELINPEKLKEPYRRIWLGCKIRYLNSKKNIKENITKEISNLLNKSNQSVFNFSKENAFFLRKVYEKYSGKKINDEAINAAISQVLQLKKFMYTESRAKKLKFLYEKLRSPERIVDYLIELGEINIPHRQTIKSHLSRYFENNQKDFAKWLKENPNWSIGVSNNFISYFPKELRNLLCLKSMQLIKRYGINSSKVFLRKLLIQEFEKSRTFIMIWLNKSPEYHIPFHNYLDSIMYFIIKLHYISQNGLTLNYTELSNDSNIPFHRTAIRNIIRYLLDSNIISF